MNIKERVVYLLMKYTPAWIKELFAPRCIIEVTEGRLPEVFLVVGRYKFRPKSFRITNEDGRKFFAALGVDPDECE